MPAPAAIVIPTRARPEYLRVALASVIPQARESEVEVVVVDDGPNPATQRVCVDLGARCVVNPTPRRGINVARNLGAASTDAALLVFLDDDVEVRAGWLAALLGAASALPYDVGFLTGPVHARLEDHPLRSCGREGPPITAFDAGPHDVDVPKAWGVNLAVRRLVLDEVGPWDEGLVNGGDEEELQQRWVAFRAAAGRQARIRYVAAAAVDHRRAGDDARLRALTRAARSRGAAARRFDVHRGGPVPTLRAEVRVLAGCLLHVPRFRCLNGFVMAAHARGRIDEALHPTPQPAEDFLSGASGRVGGWRARGRTLQDVVLDVASTPQRRRRPAGDEARLNILVLGLDQPGIPGTMDATRAELARSRHALTWAVAPAVPTRGKFENLNALLGEHDVAAFDRVLVVDDDVDLPRGFLDAFVHHARPFDLAQPAHRRRSHGAWPHTRRRGALAPPARSTSFVEIGPVTLFGPRTFATLLPFPPLRMGWGLDAHWAALARDNGWRLGIVDATPVGHVVRPVAHAYPREDAIAEARLFLADRPYLRRDEVR